MNKKLLLCAAIASSLFLAACVKKEAPTEEQAEEVEVSTDVASEPSLEFTPLEPVDEQPVEAVEPAQSEDYYITESPTTTQPSSNTQTAAPKAEAAKAQDTPTEFAPKDKSSTQSQEDAVADAIAAAMPALEN